jgi:glutathione S-transferase
MKLYYAPGVCSLSPHIILRETDTPFTLVKTDIKAKTIEGGGDFLKVSPNGYVPVLELDDGRIITEGPAILQYVADTAKATTLCPPCGTFERADLQSWLNFISTELHKGFSPLFNPRLDEAAKAVHREKLLERIAYLERHLAGRDYIMGARFMLPDAYAFTVLGWSRPLKLDLSGFKTIEAYRHRIQHRPAVQAAMRAEGLIK